jgi:hypothetical protein
MLAMDGGSGTAYTHLESIHEIRLAGSVSPAAKWDRNLPLRFTSQNHLLLLSTFSHELDEQHQESSDRKRLVDSLHKLIVGIRPEEAVGEERYCGVDRWHQ